MQSKRLHKAGMLDEPSKHARLRAARSRRYDTAKAAAAALGVPYGTYSGHESGSRGFSNREAERYAKFFKVPAEWLILGAGTSNDVTHDGFERDVTRYAAGVRLLGDLKPLARDSSVFLSLALSDADSVALMRTLIEANEAEAISFLKGRGSI